MCMILQFVGGFGLFEALVFESSEINGCFEMNKVACAL